MPRNKREPTKSRWTDEEDYDEHCRVILQMSVRTVSIIQYDPNEEDVYGKVILAFTPRTGGIDLTHLNMNELQLFRTILLEAIKRAEPIVAERDRATEESLRRGEVRNRRLWRAEPRYIEFDDGGVVVHARKADDAGVSTGTGSQGNGGEHDPGVPSRP